MTQEAEKALEAVREALELGGRHDGPCDNEPDEACSIHVRTAEARRRAALDALRSLRTQHAKAQESIVNLRRQLAKARRQRDDLREANYRLRKPTDQMQQIQPS